MMDPMVGSVATGVDNPRGDIVSDSSDNADLLDFCFLCSCQFFHENLDNYGTERLKDEDVLETFFEELGPVDRALLQCCPTCKALCKTLLRTKEALSSLIDEITRLLLRSRKVSFLLSKSRVVSRLFHSSNSSLPPCETSTSYLQQPLSQINFSKEASSNMTTGGNDQPSDCFPTQFHLRLDSSNLSMGDLDLALIPPTQSTATAISVIKRSPLSSNKLKRGEDVDDAKGTSTELTVAGSSSSFSSIYSESIMNSVSDNACDISEGVIRHHQHSQNQSGPKVTNIPRSPALIPIKKVPLPKSPQGPCKPEQKVNPTVLTFAGNRDAKQDEGNCKDDKNATSLINCDEVGETELPIVNQNEMLLANHEIAENSSIPISKMKIIEGGHSTAAKKNPTQHQCLTCNKSFKSGRNLRNHIAAHNQERKFICEICGVSYRHKIGLEAHVSIHNGDPSFQCKLCDKAFTQKSGLQRHMRLHTGKFQFQCDTCGKQFIHHSSFSVHKLIHEGVKGINCPHCEFVCSDKSHLKRHIRIHTGEKPFKCQHCERSFSERYNLQAHLKTHEDDPKNLFKCPKCFKCFTRKFKLKQHVEKIHSSFTL